MYHSIMVPLDGSLFGEQALPLACSIARRVGATLRLAHAHLPLLPMFIETVPIFDEEREAQVRAAEQAYLESLARHLAADHSIAVTTSLLDAPVDDALLADAAAASVDLVVMATHGRGALSRFWLGSVAERLVRRATMPILLVRPTDKAPDPPPEPSIRHVLVPLDGSSLAEQVLPHAIAIGSVEGEYILLQSIEAVESEYGTELYAAGRTEAGYEQLRANAHCYLDRVAKHLRAESLRVHTRVVDGPPARAILEYARDQGVDLIAMATHGSQRHRAPAGWRRRR
jgi:nucleotide-binding universal stress UspA family protein